MTRHFFVFFLAFRQHGTPRRKSLSLFNVTKIHLLRSVVSVWPPPPCARRAGSLVGMALPWPLLFRTTGKRLCLSRPAPPPPSLIGPACSFTVIPAGASCIPLRQCPNGHHVTFVQRAFFFFLPQRSLSFWNGVILVSSERAHSGVFLVVIGTGSPRGGRAEVSWDCGILIWHPLTVLNAVGGGGPQLLTPGKHQ